jgi:putative component of toxin-antitoxin plasmid stabilization module
MNELELAQFALPAAHALLTAMVSDGWQAFKSRLARIVAGRSGDVDLAEGTLDELRQRVIESQQSRDVQQRQNEIFALLCATLARDPESATPLKDLIADIEAHNSSVHAKTITQNATVHDEAVAFQQISGTQNYQA